MPAGRILRSRARKSAANCRGHVEARPWVAACAQAAISEMGPGGQCQALKELQISRDLWVLFLQRLLSKMPEEASCFQANACIMRHPKRAIGCNRITALHWIGKWSHVAARGWGCSKHCDLQLRNHLQRAEKRVGVGRFGARSWPTCFSTLWTTSWNKLKVANIRIVVARQWFCLISLDVSIRCQCLRLRESLRMACSSWLNGRGPCSTQGYCSWYCIVLWCQRGRLYWKHFIEIYNIVI